MRRPRVIPPIYFALAVAAMVLLHVFFPVRYVLTWPWRWAGVLPIAMGLSLTALAGRAFRRWKTTVRPGGSPSHLVTEGPFRLTRNPMYLGLVLLLIGLAGLLGSVSPWVIIPLFVLVIDRSIIPLEEEKMGRIFGEEYERYRQRVRRWI